MALACWKWCVSPHRKQQLRMDVPPHVSSRRAAEIAKDRPLRDIGNKLPSRAVRVKSVLSFHDSYRLLVGIKPEGLENRIEGVFCRQQTIRRYPKLHKDKEARHPGGIEISTPAALTRLMESKGVTISPDSCTGRSGEDTHPAKATRSPSQMVAVGATKRDCLICHQRITPVRLGASDAFIAIKSHTYANRNQYSEIH